MRIFRPHRGNFDAWRRYQILVDGADNHRISDTQLLEIEGDTHVLAVTVGRYNSDPLTITADGEHVVLCELTANPHQEAPAVQISVVSEAEAQQRVVRFDRPPYPRGTVVGLSLGILSTAITSAICLVIGFLVAVNLPKLAHPADAIDFIFLACLGLFLCCVTGFAGVSAMRGLYRYFRLPRGWRH